MTTHHRSLVLHIGKNKAGSSAIQKQIRRLDTPMSRSRLISTFVRLRIVPLKALGFPNAKLLSCAFQSPAAKDYFVRRRGTFSAMQFSDIGAALWPELENELGRSRATRFVASSEYIWAFLQPEDIRALRQHLSRYFDEIQIIVYLRDQRSDLPSAWAQTVKGPTRSARSFQHFMDRIECCPGRWDYATTLKAWGDVFGPAELSVGMFDRSALRAGDVVTDFFHRGGIGDIALRRGRKTTNRTPGWETIEAKRRENHLAANGGRSEGFIESDPVREIEASRARITDLVSSGNHWINEAFFKDQPIKLPEK